MFLICSIYPIIISQPSEETPEEDKVSAADGTLTARVQAFAEILVDATASPERVGQVKEELVQVIPTLGISKLANLFSLWKHQGVWDPALSRLLVHHTIQVVRDQQNLTQMSYLNKILEGVVMATTRSMAHLRVPAVWPWASGDEHRLGVAPGKYQQLVVALTRQAKVVALEDVWSQSMFTRFSRFFWLLVRLKTRYRPAPASHALEELFEAWFSRIKVKDLTEAHLLVVVVAMGHLGFAHVGRLKEIQAAIIKLGPSARPPLISQALWAFTKFQFQELDGPAFMEILDLKLSSFEGPDIVRVLESLEVTD